MAMIEYRIIYFTYYLYRNELCITTFKLFYYFYVKFSRKSAKQEKYSEIPGEHRYLST